MLAQVPNPPENYVSRPQEEQKITRLIAQSQKDAQSIVVLYGMDGYGKSTLAKAICHAPDIRKIFAENIYWLEPGGKEGTERIGIKELYKQLKNLAFPLNAEITYTDLETELRGKQCMVVLDDLQEKDVLIKFLQAGKSSCCTWLITTQKLETIPSPSEAKNNYICPSIHRLHISGMKRDEAFKLLGYGWTEFDSGKLQKLADRLYEFPQLITLVRSQIDHREIHNQTTIDEAIDSVNEDLNQLGISGFVEESKPEKSEELFLGLLYTLILPDDKERLKELSIFHSDVSIPLSVVGRLWNQDRSRVNFICQRLHKYSMLKQCNLSKEKGMIILNDTVRRYYFEKESKEKIRDTHEKLLRAYEALPEETVLSQEEENYLRHYLPYHWKKAGRSSNPSPVPNFPNFPMHILHLSDLHFGTPNNADNWHNQLAEDLIHELDCPHLDALILSGDIANKSTPEEYTAAKQFLDNLCQEFELQPEQIVIVPGNHDLNWEISEEAYTPKRRKAYKGPMIDERGEKKPDPNYSIDQGEYVEVLEPEQYKKRFANFCDFYQIITGKSYPLEYEQQGILYHFPKQNFLILGLNSAWQLDHNYKSRASINADAINKALTDIRRDQAYKNCIKIAVWHHPLNSAFEDRIIDHGFMEQLAKAGFRFALHGHIHKAETSLFKYDMSAGGRKLDIICAGTFGAPVCEWVDGYPLQYNLLKFEDNKLTVHTRRREELNGAWKPDARWSMGAGQNPLPHYEIQLFAR